MSVLSFLALAWFVYNSYTYSSYAASFKKGLRNYKKIVALESQVLITTSEDDDEEEEIPKIQNRITFFKRTVPGLQPKTVEFEQNRENIEDASVDDLSYKLEFDSISRKDLARYIFYIKKQALSLKVKLQVKEIEMRKVEKSKSYDDVWKVTSLEFVHRISVP